MSVTKELPPVGYNSQNYDGSDSSDQLARLEQFERHLMNVDSSEYKRLDRATIILRLSELEYLKSLGELQNLAAENNDSDIEKACQRYFYYSDLLFDKPNVDSHNELNVYKATNAGDFNSMLYTDLTRGYVMELASGVITVPPIIDSLKIRFKDDESQNLILEQIERQYARVLYTVNGYYQTDLMNRDKSAGLFTPIDQFIILKLLRSGLGDKDTFQVYLDNESDEVKWADEQQAIIFGGQQAAITGRPEASAKIISTYRLHSANTNGHNGVCLPIFGKKILADY